jgi:hypothetical protein
MIRHELPQSAPPPRDLERHKLNWLSRHRVRCALHGDQLACGCIVGIYELYSGDVLSVIDARDPACSNHQHQPHIVIGEEAGASRPHRS